MINQRTIYQGLSHAAWGYFFFNFDLNLGTVSVIPRFVGFLLLMSAGSKLSGHRQDLALLRPLCILLSAWNGADWLLSWFGESVNGKVLFLDLLITAAELYLHFQFLTDMAALAEMYQDEGEDLDRRLRNRRTVYVVMYTAVVLFSGFAAESNKDWQQDVMTIGAVVTGIAALFVMSGLFALRRCAKGKGLEDVS